MAANHTRYLIGHLSALSLPFPWGIQWSTPVATSVTLTSIQITPAGLLRANFADGNQLEFADRAELASSVADAVDADWARKALLAHWLALNPALDNPALINGKTLEANLESVLNPVSIGVV